MALLKHSLARRTALRGSKPCFNPIAPHKMLFSQLPIVTDWHQRQLSGYYLLAYPTDDYHFDYRRIYIFLGR